MSQSLLDLAYSIILERHQDTKGDVAPVPFRELWKEMMKKTGQTDSEANNFIGDFYMNLILDNRFVSRGDNTWDLRQFFTLEEVSENTDFYREEGLEETEFEETEVEVKDSLDINEIDPSLGNEDETGVGEEIRLEDVTDPNYN